MARYWARSFFAFAEALDGSQRQPLLPFLGHLFEGHGLNLTDPGAKPTQIEGISDQATNPGTRAMEALPLTGVVPATRGLVSRRDFMLLAVGSGFLRDGQDRVQLGRDLWVKFVLGN